jgi:hypothetical protein
MASSLPVPAGPVVVASHRRSGTHLAIDLLRRQFAACDAWKWPGEGLEEVYLNLERLGPHRRPISVARAERVLRRARRPVVKTHLLPDLEPVGSAHGPWLDRLLAHSQTIYVVRDGRDVMPSWQQQQMNWSPAAHCSLSEFIRLCRNGRSRVREWAHHVESWIDREGIYVLRYERLVGDGERVLRELESFLGLPPRLVTPLVPPLVRSKWRKRLMRFTSIRPPTTALTGTRRPAPWRESFTREDRTFFEEEAGALLRRLGYETSSDWVEEAQAPAA